MNPRLVKKLVSHEMCHTFGALHCSTPGYAMTNYKGSIRTMDKSNDVFYPIYREKI
jgi:predicted Zn-dependent protease